MRKGSKSRMFLGLTERIQGDILGLKRGCLEESVIEGGKDTPRYCAFPTNHTDVSLALEKKKRVTIWRIEVPSFFPEFDQLKKEENPKELTPIRFFYSFFPQDFLSQA